MKTRLFTLILLFLLISISSFAQKETQIGLIGLVEDNPNGSFKFQGGLIIDQQLTKRSGFEVGLITRNIERGWNVEATFPDGSNEFFFYTVKEMYLNIPVLYKFYTRFLNISIGPTLDVFTAWRQTSGDPDINVESYDVDPGVTFGLMGKISKDFNLSEEFILSPEIRINPLNDTRTYLGIGAVIKYRVSTD